MKVTLEFAKVLTVIRPELPRSMDLDLPEGATLKDALAAAGVPQGLWGVTLVGDRVCGTGESLSDGDKVTVLPPVSGG